MRETIGLKNILQRFPEPFTSWMDLTGGTQLLFEKAAEQDIQTMIRLQRREMIKAESDTFTPEQLQKGFTLPLDELIKMHYHLPTVHRDRSKLPEEVSPLLMFVTDMIFYLEKERGTPSHYIRSTTVTDVMTSLRPGFNRRSHLGAAISETHSYEKTKVGSYEDQVKQFLYKGSDLDIVAEFNYQIFTRSFAEQIESYYGQYHEASRLAPWPLTQIHSLEKNGIKTQVWRVNRMKTPLFARNLDQTNPTKGLLNYVFIRMTEKRTRSGIPMVDLELCTNPEFKVSEGDLNGLDVVFSIGLASFSSLAPEVQALDLRSTDKTNTWDRKGHGRFVKLDKSKGSPLASVGIQVDGESVKVLTQRVKPGEKFNDMEPLAKFEEILRILRKSIVHERMLYLTEEGRAQLNADRREFDFPLAVPFSELRRFKELLESDEFKNSLWTQWNQFTPEQKKYNCVKLAGEIMTKVFYAPKKTFRLLQELRIRHLFPDIADISENTWMELTAKLPDQHEYEIETSLAANPPIELLEQLYNEYPHFDWVSILVKFNRDIPIFDKIQQLGLKSQGFPGSNQYRMRKIISVYFDKWVRVNTGFTTLARMFCFDPSVRKKSA